MESISIPLYQVDAFTPRPFKGNPAAVCLLTRSYEDSILKAIASEMNLSETAFVTRKDTRAWSDATVFGLRWFTPLVEVPLCGHATLATAAVLFSEIGIAAPAITFHTLSGQLIAQHTGDGIMLDFPVDEPTVCQPPSDVLSTLGLAKVEGAAFGPRTGNLLLRLSDPALVRALRPDFAALLRTPGMRDRHGLIVTARGDPPYDFVSRYFAPQVGVNEDPVTGSAHTLLTPYWSALLGKPEMHAYQSSARGGELTVRMAADGRVELEGKALIVFKGRFYL